ncbi:hypothetical protein [Rubinisphaera sp.]|uniref:hypothetical protein n=1 Tax=Rubinisphaera sp. TaxID=2024857 RepID=UPI0025D87A3B|nr:hypothetical protein [Rubinisphaera sp.]
MTDLSLLELEPPITSGANFSRGPHKKSHVQQDTPVVNQAQSNQQNFDSQLAHDIRAPEICQFVAKNR